MSPVREYRSIEQASALPRADSSNSSSERSTGNDHVKGIPVSFFKANGNSGLAREFLRFNEAQIDISKPLFSFQRYFVTWPLPTVDNPLNESIGYPDTGVE